MFRVAQDANSMPIQCSEIDANFTIIAVDKGFSTEKCARRAWLLPVVDQIALLRPRVRNNQRQAATRSA